MNFFKKRKYIPISNSNDQNEKILVDDSPNIPDGLWVKCPHCLKAVYRKEMDVNNICPKCGGYFRISSYDRIKAIIDENTFKEFDSNLKTLNPLKYPGYEEKISSLEKNLKLSEAVITGRGRIFGIRTVIGVMDSRFIMGSMGSVVGEKLTRAIEFATKNNLPVIIFTASGGARMQEGIVSLMQMAKVSAALKKHSDSKNLYISVLTDPTTGGVTASFAMLGDIIISEPKALIGFAGRRVIEQTIKENLPEDFQSAEFLLEHGFIDKIVNREDMKEVLHKILLLHVKRNK